LLEAGAGFDEGHQHRDQEDELALVGIETALGFEDRLQRGPERVGAGFRAGGGEAFAVVGGGEAGVVSGVGDVVAHAAQGMECLRHGRIDQGEPGGQADLGGETAEGALRTEEGVVCSTTLLACSAAVCTSESGLILAALIAQVFVEGGVVEQDGL